MPAAASPKKIEFQSVQYGLWVYETDLHRLEVRLIHGAERGRAHSYDGTLTTRPNGRLLKRCTSRQMHEVQQKLIKGLEDATRPDRLPRQIISFEHWADEKGAMDFLRRRCDAYVKRHGLRILSEKIVHTAVDNRPTIQLNVCTEVLPQSEPTPCAP